ncbi:MAG: hypothetical protein OEM77_06895 [Nitrosopumilus sp.]|nr:hypothetical protein [Nitrosopumilus sp.]MDH3737414.1 hypothetical protein [Nitrosopumilus sp.]MDH3823960.1 hypothetical protein [Nitrosopumilus sp.]MDH3834306.1 hypothetical protein [Nitrosopumilus sp.]
MLFLSVWAYLLDHTSMYKAMLSGIDPTPIELIEFIKNKL